MSHEFDPKYWDGAIARPDWYMEFVPYAQEQINSFNGEQERIDSFRRVIRHFFEVRLLEERVALASEGPNLDAERLPADTIVVHHTSHTPGYRLSYLNAVHLLNIYAPYYTNPTLESEKALKGQPLWSGHFYEGKQVFWGYHWMLRMDGQAQRLLDDGHIGWQSGDWNINRRGIGICLDNDYEHQDPTPETLETLADLIKTNYPDIDPQNVIGHLEARNGTTCPGGNFLSGWKHDLQNLLSS